MHPPNDSYDVIFPSINYGHNYPNLEVIVSILGKKQSLAIASISTLLQGGKYVVVEESHAEDHTIVLLCEHNIFVW